MTGSTQNRPWALAFIRHMAHSRDMTNATRINQSSSLAKMMDHAGFRRTGASWTRKERGATYKVVAGGTIRTPPTDALSPVHVVGPSGFHNYSTVLEMALVWGMR